MIILQLYNHYRKGCNIKSTRINEEEKKLLSNDKIFQECFIIQDGKKILTQSVIAEYNKGGINIDYPIKTSQGTMYGNNFAKHKEKISFLCKLIKEYGIEKVINKVPENMFIDTLTDRITKPISEEEFCGSWIKEKDKSGRIKAIKIPGLKEELEAILKRPL